MSRERDGLGVKSRTLCSHTLDKISEWSNGALSWLLWHSSLLPKFRTVRTQVISLAGNNSALRTSKMQHGFWSHSGSPSRKCLALPNTLSAWPGFLGCNSKGNIPVLASRSNSHWKIK
jgi:hypothetical protein